MNKISMLNKSYIHKDFGAFLFCAVLRLSAKSLISLLIWDFGIDLTKGFYGKYYEPDEIEFDKLISGK